MLHFVIPRSRRVLVAAHPLSTTHPQVALIITLT